MNMKQAIIIVIIVVVVAAGIVLINHTFRSSSSKSTSSPATTADTTLQSQDISLGSGPVAKAGDKLGVIYTGTLTNGNTFDSNVGKDPFVFALGGGQVIAGWDQGLVGMKAGGRRKLTIPPALGYGDQAAGSIPPNSTLIFDVQLVSIN